MSLLTLVKEFWRFFKDYLIKIALGSLIFGLVAVGARHFLTNQRVEGQDEAYDYLSKAYEQEPAEFQFILTNSDGTLFDNSFVFDEYFASPAVTKQVAKETGVPFADFAKYEETLGLLKTSQFRGGLAAVRNTSTNVITMRFLVSPSKEENLKVAQAYYKLMTEKKIPFIKDHNLTIVSEPVIGELLNMETTNNVALPSSLSSFGSNTIRGSLIFGVAGFMFGLIAMTGLLFLLHLLKKRITYGFDYAWNFEDSHLVYNRQRTDNVEDFEKLLLVPEVDQRVVVSQVKPDLGGDRIKNISDLSMIYVNQLQELANKQIKPDDIVIMVYSNQTEKSWYHEQAVIAHMYQVPVKIIHVI